jgi:crotonobetainyl-CoA:carnitine CoA-transferase CaiB-like acyl-CoA transferase
MSTYLVELNPDPNAAPETTSLFEAQKKFAQYFQNYDIHGMASSPLRSQVSNMYKARDGRFVHTHASLNPTDTLKALGLPPDVPEVRSREDAWKALGDIVAEKDAAEWEPILGESPARQAATICLSASEYKASEQAKAIADVGLYKLNHHASAAQAPSWWPSTPDTGPARPLAGLKVLDLTRVIASPTITRGLAELGASVMRVTAPHLPDYSGLLPDLNWGKWNCSLDFRVEEDRQRLQALLKAADVVVNGYRPGVLDKYGLGFVDVQKIGDERGRGFIYVRENCFGWAGPMKHRSGWQPISDAHTGVSWSFGKAMGLDEPVSPVFPHSDFITGIAGTCAVLQALIEKAEKGGSFLVDTALNYCNQWLMNEVGEYPEEVWRDVWSRASKPVFRHHHNTGFLLGPHMKICAELGLFQKDFLEIRDCGALGGLKMRVVKPVIQFPDGVVKPGFNVSTRGNGVDQPHWPDDLATEFVT